MATYAIGDVQGCLGALQRMIDLVGFSRDRDTLWVAGDLVNRGPDSVGVLRFMRGLGASAIVVLGNHDLHLLMVAEGYARQHRGDTLTDVLGAPDRDELLDWLRAQRMFHADGEYAMVHAGLLPSWSVPRARELAQELETALRRHDRHEFMQNMYGNLPERWDDTLAGHDRLRVITNAMTRMRLCSNDGVMEFSHKTAPVNVAQGLMPWFDVPGRASRQTTIVCGHWASLGLLQRPDLLALDSGCVWGRCLSAVRLEDRKLFQVSCGDLATPESGQ